MQRLLRFALPFPTGQGTATFPVFPWPYRVLTVAMRGVSSTGDGGIQAQIIDGANTSLASAMALATFTGIGDTVSLYLAVNAQERRFDDGAGAQVIQGGLPPDFWVMPGERLTVGSLGELIQPSGLIIGILV